MKRHPQFSLLFSLLFVLGLLTPSAAARAAAVPAWSSTAADESLQALFAAANEAYRAAAYDDARLRWESLFEAPALTDEDRARVALALGNTAWRTERAMEAIGWYTLATRLDGRNADARSNLEHARSEQGLEPDDRGDLRSTVERLLAWPRASERRWAVLVGALVLAMTLLGEALRGGPAWRRLALVGGLAFALTCVPWLYGMAPRTTNAYLVIDKPSLTMRSEPRGGVGATGEVRAGATVERIDALADWIRIQTAEGERGWVQSRGVFALTR